MLTNRLIACLDVVKGNVTKAVGFQDNLHVAPAVDVAADLYEQGIDEIIFYDIHASAERRSIDLDTVRGVAKRVFVPFTVGGGLKSLEDMHAALKAGAEKVSVDSMAVRNPHIIAEGAKAFGRQCIVLSMQVKRVPKTAKIPSGFEIAIDGARTFTGLDAVEWAKRGEGLGAGEICVNSIDNDGGMAGYDLELLNAIGGAVRVPFIASGGAGAVSHVAELFRTTESTAAIISSMLYSPRTTRHFTVSEIKAELLAQKLPVRPLVAAA
jgi:imidazole glycerol-phosphate synthase subunit HisF